jgi:hypothetical protein
VGFLSRTPKEISRLEQEIIAAKVALSLASRFDEARRRHTIQTAKTSLQQAAAVAAKAGHSEAARGVIEKHSSPPADPAGAAAWPDVVAAGLAELP